MNKNLLLLGLHHLLRDLPMPCSGVAAALVFLAGGSFPWGCVLSGVWCHLRGVGDQLGGFQAGSVLSIPQRCWCIRCPGWERAL